MEKHSPLTFDDVTIQKLFGYEDAESESIERLREYYFKTDTFKRVIADLPLRILVGHKGTGKSALFKIAMFEESEQGNLPIMIKPDDIAELGNSDENFLLKIRQWKYGLTKIIGTKVFNEVGLTDDTYISKLNQFGIKLISFLSESITYLKSNVNLGPSQERVIANFLEKRKIIVFLDDLDRGWQGKKNDILRISALLNAIRDMANDNPGLLFKVSLRSDVYYLVRTSDESTDKIEGSVVWFKWTNHEILVMLIKRIMTFFEETPNEQQLMTTPQRFICFHLDDVFEKRFLGKGKWDNVPMYRVIMSLIRKRPRDLVKLCTLAAQNACADGSNIIRTNHFSSIFEEYSQGRIQDTINEYKSELPQIEKLILGMKPSRKQKYSSNGYIYSSIELHQKINSIREQNNFTFTNNSPTSAKELAQFLYKINFLTARKEMENNEIQRRYFEENRYLSNSFVDFGYDWEVHPAFRWALQPDMIDNIFFTLGLSKDD